MSPNSRWWLFLFVLLAVEGAAASPPLTQAEGGQQPNMVVCTIPYPSHGGESDARSELRRSRQFLQEHRNQLAIEAAVHATELDNSADSWYQLALARFTAGYPECSLQAFTQAATFRTPDSEQLRIVALDYVLLNDPIDAEKWLRGSLAMDSNNSEAWYDLARVFYDTARYEEAAASLQRSTVLQPHQSRVDIYLGLIDEMTGHSGEAEVHYRAALKYTEATQAERSLTLRSLGVLLCHENRALEGAEDLELASSLSPTSPDDHLELARCYVALERFSQAKGQLELASRLGDESAALHFTLGRVDRSLGLTDEANRQFRKAKQQLDERHRTARP